MIARAGGTTGEIGQELLQLSHRALWFPPVTRARADGRRDDLKPRIWRPRLMEGGGAVYLLPSAQVLTISMTTIVAGADQCQGAGTVDPAAIKTCRAGGCCKSFPATTLTSSRASVWLRQGPGRDAGDIQQCRVHSASGRPGGLEGSYNCWIGNPVRRLPNQIPRISCRFNLAITLAVGQICSTVIPLGHLSRIHSLAVVAR